MEQGGQHGGGGTEAAGGVGRRDSCKAMDNQVSGLVPGQIQETFTTSEGETRFFGRKGNGKRHHLETKETRCGRRECVHALNTGSINGSKGHEGERTF